MDTVTFYFIVRFKNLCIVIFSIPVFCHASVFYPSRNCYKACWVVSLSTGVQVPEFLTKFSTKKDLSTRSRKNAENSKQNPLEKAREQFEIAAKAKCDLGFRWLKRLDEEEKRLTNP